MDEQGNPINKTPSKPLKGTSSNKLNQSSSHSGTKSGTRVTGSNVAKMSKQKVDCLLCLKFTVYSFVCSCFFCSVLTGLIMDMVYLYLYQLNSDICSTCSIWHCTVYNLYYYHFRKSYKHRTLIWSVTSLNQTIRNAF